MDRRKDTELKGTKIPKDYIKMVEDVFNKNFKSKLSSSSKNKEVFLAFGEIYPDELLLAICLKNNTNLKMTTCYASVDFPPSAGVETPTSKKSTSAADDVQLSVSRCVDAIASFYQTYFDENRPIDYDMEYNRSWSVIELEKKVYVYILVNRDNLELDAQADEILAADEEALEAKRDKIKKSKLH